MPKKKTTSVTKKAAKKTTAKKKAPMKKAVAKKKGTADKESSAEKVADTTAKKASVARTGVAADRKSTPIVFSLDDVEELMASKKAANIEKPIKKAVPKAAKKAAPVKKTVIEEKPIEKRVLGAASLADILGFNPSEKKSRDLSDNDIPKKWQKYYKLLIELRNHVSDEIDLHTSDTLKHSSRDDAGDLSSYGNHQADAGTDTFDRDFALSLVSSEQEALNEIEEAIMRIKDGSYGVCEVTGKPIPAARLTAVPFARYSVEGQAEYEKNVRRKVDRGVNTGLFGDASDAPKIASSDDDDE
ncbi:MAG: TraR/DksA C4-type zinc finger protein [Verrucomicrobiota bacterium]